MSYSEGPNTLKDKYCIKSNCAKVSHIEIMVSFTETKLSIFLVHDIIPVTVYKNMNKYLSSKYFTKPRQNFNYINLYIITFLY